MLLALVQIQLGVIILVTEDVFSVLSSVPDLFYNMLRYGSATIYINRQIYSRQQNLLPLITMYVRQSDHPLVLKDIGKVHFLKFMHFSGVNYDLFLQWVKGRQQ